MADASTKLVVGLGNPGPRYAESRHNVGFMVVEELARRWKSDVSRFDRDFQALVGEAQRGGRRVLLVEPQTFMNLSGRSVGAVLRFYKLEWSDVLIVLDDMDLPLGALRLRAGGSAGGHNGLADVIRSAGGAEVPRLRLGIGRGHEAVSFVLGGFTPQEREAVTAATGMAADAAECWLSEGMTTAMNRFNRRRDTD
ncbi:MAG: aminoacyl-tRNA hydrolase [Planctomycetia bacterium]|nr:MAG: aminoacyl-tRNA hydrolase [Planctomycetia bacterium]